MVIEFLVMRVDLVIHGRRFKLTKKSVKSVVPL